MIANYANNLPFRAEVFVKSNLNKLFNINPAAQEIGKKLRVKEIDKELLLKAFDSRNFSYKRSHY